MPTASGAWLGTADSSFTVGGAGVHRVLADLMTGLDGSRSAEDLLDAAGAGREVRARLLDVLAERGYVVDLALPVGELVERYGPGAGRLVADLAQRHRDPAAALGRIVTGAVLLVGPASARAALRRALGSYALQGPTVQELADRGALHEALSHTDPSTAVVVDLDPEVEPGATPPPLLGPPAWRQVVAGTLGDAVWVAPSTGASPACWPCLARAAPDDGTTAPPVDGPLVAAVIADAVHALLAAPGDASVLADPVASVHADVRVDRHRAWSGQGCRCGRVPRTTTGSPPVLPPRPLAVAPGEVRDDLGFDRLADRTASWVDPQLGPLLRLDEADLAQVPLGRVVGEVLRETGEQERRHWTRGRVTSVAVTSREARHEAALAAVELVAASARGQDGTTAAGWSLDEAVYRALVRQVRDLPADGTDPAGPERSAGPDHAGGDCGRYCSFVERAAEHLTGHAPRWGVAVRRRGLAVVHGHLGGQEVRGVGLCPDEARISALLTLLADRSSPVVVPPQAASWDDVWSTVLRPAHRPVAARDRLPFPTDQVVLVCLS
ncbi:hypothetical protein GCM10011519_29780 [Marmoricola endophyticus]|uniref:Uncharacterized protein n=1 Tax=Marmoricola endophyticus TaxID=2040280 RepID=A0A917BPG9_9ACTN|nr:hypothetical protein GCM10011519_29780 [Marmoricola endophyticus]